MKDLSLCCKAQILPSGQCIVCGADNYASTEDVYGILRSIEALLSKVEDPDIKRAILRLTSHLHKIIASL